MRALVLIALVACSSPPARIRVMSYNLNFGLAGDTANLRAIDSAKPDVVFVQESNAGWEQALVDVFRSRFPHRRFAGPTGRLAAGGMGVLSRYPIVSLETLTAPNAPFFAWRVVLDTPLGAIQVFNLHLRPPMSDEGSWLVGYFSTRDDRLREITHHLAALDPALPAIVLGDLNEERGGGHAIEMLAKRGFTDAIERFAGNRPTWEWNAGGAIKLQLQLDHILHDARLAATAAAIVEAGRSDHKPIWADITRVRR